MAPGHFHNDSVMNYWLREVVVKTVFLDDIPKAAYYFSMKTKVGERGQITIPKKLRDRYGVQPGMELELHESAEGIVLRKQDLASTLERLKGTVYIGNLSTDEFLAKVRDGEE